ncbi:methyltransferase domain-containing protein [Mesorhizobium sp. B2-5-13]|nr:methyltransferase domain-containing protein [Mesorhizobium sp. B2-5-13]TPK52382.1 methyltransferase domain-containing protein [Mesorhizobium sp. B2-5-5]
MTVLPPWGKPKARSRPRTFRRWTSFILAAAPPRESWQGNLRLPHRVLDIGCGLSGPARQIAAHYGCQVTGIDLTRDYIDAGNVLSSWLHLEELVSLQQGDALGLPFPDGSFTAAYMLHVGMNIADKGALFSEVARVLGAVRVLVSSTSCAPGRASWLIRCHGRVRQIRTRSPRQSSTVTRFPRRGSRFCQSASGAMLRLTISRGSAPRRLQGEQYWASRHSWERGAPRWSKT